MYCHIFSCVLITKLIRLVNWLLTKYARSWDFPSYNYFRLQFVFLSLGMHFFQNVSFFLFHYFVQIIFPKIFSNEISNGTTQFLANKRIVVVKCSYKTTENALGKCLWTRTVFQIFEWKSAFNTIHRENIERIFRIAIISCNLLFIKWKFLFKNSKII